MLRAFDRFERKSHAGDNRKAVLSSAIIAKAVLRSAGGETFILAVFQKSTAQEFYWVFRARSPRSSRRSWKYVDHYMRNFSFVRPPYVDFGSLVAYHALTHKLTVVSQKVTRKRQLGSLLSRTAHESIYSDWTPQNPGLIVTDRCRARAQRARAGRLSW
jgi:hypothetical protein